MPAIMNLLFLMTVFGTGYGLSRMRFDASTVQWQYNPAGFIYGILFALLAVFGL